MKKLQKASICVSLLLLCAFALQLCGCAAQLQEPEQTQDLAPAPINATNLMADITPNAVDTPLDLSGQNAAVTDFAVRLFQAGEEKGQNTLISPLSVLCALAMTANGAEGETLVQMEEVLGMTTRELNAYLHSYMKALPQGEKYKLNLANSIWFTEDTRFTVNRDFLQTNADYYGADIFKAPFDMQTCRDINNWVKQKTDGMISEVLNEIPSNAVMYLINALVFEAEWSDIYQEYQIRDGEFTKDDGSRQTLDFMYSTEGTFLADEQATGFVKYYKGGKYAFVAMLPNEGVSVSEYVASLDGASLHAMLEDPQYYTVHAAIPRFETGYSAELSSLLRKMGMTDAFDPGLAALGGLGTSSEGNIFISRVLHKTFLALDSRGTKAGAVTVVEPADAAAPVPQEIKEVYLDRPFVYMLIDCENNIPFFLGTMLDPAA